MMKNIGSTITIVLAVLVLITGLTQPNASYINAGIIMLIGAFAYRSAKKRSLGEVKNTTVRKAIELTGITIIILLVVLQKNLLDLLYLDPVPNFIIPVWTLIAYLVVFLKKKST